MISPIRRGGRLGRWSLARRLAAACVCSATGLVTGVEPAAAGTCPLGHANCAVHGAGAAPGYQGFGLGYHLGFGYGGDALGVGPNGGHPFYGGPGYPHPEPPLRRCGRIVPFAYDGGPGFPAPTRPNVFAGVGPLAVDPPVVAVVRGPGESGEYADFGIFNGMRPYPESTFAPFASGDVPSRPPDSTAPLVLPVTPGSMMSLGLDTTSVVAADRTLGLRITHVHPRGAAERAGLRDGDVIRSANGYRTERPGDLAWIVANATPDKSLRLVVLDAHHDAPRAITARLP